MNKHVLSVAVAAGLACSPLMSTAATLSAKGVDLSIFGILQSEYSSIDIDSNVPTDPDAQRAIRDNGIQSRIGFDVKKDLSSGLAAIGRLEYTQIVGSGSGPGAREQWVGLQGAWGEFNAGRNQAPMKYIGGAAYDIFVATALQARGSGGAMWAPGSGFGAAGFVNNSIKYRTPGGWPVVFHALLMPSNAENTGNGAETGGAGNGLDFNLGFKWPFGSMGEVILGASGDSVNDAQDAANLDPEVVGRVGGKLNFGIVSVMAQYENISNALGSGGVDSAGTAPATVADGALIACTGGSGFRGDDSTYDPGATPNGAGQCNSAMNPQGDGKIYFAAVHVKLGDFLVVLQGGKTDADATTAADPLGAYIERKATNATAGVVYFLDKNTRLYAGYQKVTVDETDTTEPDRTSAALGMRMDF